MLFFGWLATIDSVWGEIDNKLSETALKWDCDTVKEVCRCAAFFVKYLLQQRWMSDDIRMSGLQDQDNNLPTSEKRQQQSVLDPQNLQFHIDIILDTYLEKS